MAGGEGETPLAAEQDVEDSQAVVDQDETRLAAEQDVEDSQEASSNGDNPNVPTVPHTSGHNMINKHLFNMPLTNCLLLSLSPNPLSSSMFVFLSVHV